MQLKGPKSAPNSSLKPTPNLELLVNQFNNATLGKNSDPENIYSKYCDIDKMHNVECLTKK